MRDVAIIGIGQVPVGEHWDTSLRHLAFNALQAAMQDANVTNVDALYVGNMLSGLLAGQENLGALVADFAGLRGIEAMKIEAACASGAAALRVGYTAVAGGVSNLVAVVGVEKMTDAPGDVTTSALATAADAEYEASQGVSFVALNALLMQRYMYEYGYRREDFAPFAVNAHRNARTNPNAMFHVNVTPQAYAEAKLICDPVNLLDSSPIADGAAALILAPADLAHTLCDKPVRVRASTVATDTVSVHDRRDPLVADAARLSAYRAYEAAGLSPAEIDFFELHDAFSIMAALSLEAAGFAERGRAVSMALDGEIALGGRIPIATLGGLKGRGHPVGATGVYQIVETVLQLQGEAGPNQVQDARIGMAQNIAGSGAAVYTHILERLDS